MTCAQMGGPCEAMISGNTPQELADNGTKHVAQAHPEMMEKVKNMSAEERDKWMKDLNTKWAQSPDL